MKRVFVDLSSEERFHAALAYRRPHGNTDPDAQVLLGGLAEPDYRWIRGLMESGYARYYDILAFHSYAETWSAPDVVVEKFLGSEYRNQFLADHEQYGEGEPIWINEMGYATTPSRTEEQQANWWARAISTFLAEPEIEHIGVYEIKDLDPGVKAIGDDKNYYLGLTYRDRTKKLAFRTVDLLTDLLDTGAVSPGDTLIDSSSGIYAHALALACHEFGLNCMIVGSTTIDDVLKVQLEVLGVALEQMPATTDLKLD